METSETVHIMTDRLNDEILRITYQLERLDDVALSVSDPVVEKDLRSIAAEIRRSLDLMKTELVPEEPWLAG